MPSRRAFGCCLGTVTIMDAPAAHEQEASWDVGLRGAGDPDVLAWAGRRAGRIVAAHDVTTLSGFAFERVAAGLPMPGEVVDVDMESGRVAIRRTPHVDAPGGWGGLLG